MRPTRLHLLVLGLLALVVCFAFSGVVTGRETFYHLDRFYEHEPFWRFVARSLAAGESPFWTPDIRAGYPLLANGEASLFYPATLPLALALPAHRALDVFTLLHLVLGAFFTWLYLRELRVGPPVAFFGAVAFALSGRMVASTIWAHAVAASAFFPLTLLGIERAFARRRGGFLTVAIAVGLGLLAGRPQRFVPALFVAGAYAVVVCAVGPTRRGSPGWSARWRALAGLGGAALLGACLAAVQLVPTALFVADSQWGWGVPRQLFESTGLASKTWSVSLLPTGNSDAIGSWCYPGVVVLLGLALALVQLARRDRALGSRGLFHLVAFALLIDAALPGPGTYAVLHAVPGLRSLRVPLRLLFPALFGLVVVACLAWNRLLEGRPRAAGLWLAALGSLELVAVTLATAPIAPADVYDGVSDGVALVAAQPRDETGSRYRFYAAASWLQPSQLDGNPATRRHQFLAQPPVHDLALRYDLPAAQGYGEPQFAWEEAVFRDVDLPLLSQMGARILFLPGPAPRLPRLQEPRGAASAYLNASALPRAQVVPHIEHASTPLEASRRSRAPGFDPGTTAVVEAGRGVGSRSGTGRVRLVEEKNTRVVWKTETDAPSWLLVHDTWAPGWTARVDGRAVPIYRADGTFRLVPLSGGKERVVFRYATPGLAVGAGLSAGALLAAVALGFARLRAIRGERAAGALRSS